MISICGMRRGTLFILYFTYHNGIHFLRITRVYRDYTTSLDRWAGDHPTLVLNGGVDCFVFCFIVCVKDCKALVSCDRHTLFLSALLFVQRTVKPSSRVIDRLVPRSCDAPKMNATNTYSSRLQAPLDPAGSRK